VLVLYGNLKQCSVQQEQIQWTLHETNCAFNLHISSISLIFGCSLSITQLNGGPLLVLGWREQAIRTTHNFSPRKSCGTEKLQKSQKVAT